MLRNILLVLLALIVVSKCENVRSIIPRMTGGQPTVPGQAPFVVSIQVPQQAGDNPSYCSGTIVNLNHILTSAQCAHNDENLLINPTWFRIIAGDLNMLVPSYRRFTTSASHIYTHPSYTISPRTNDIAVMRTSTSFPSTHNTIDWAIRNTHVLPIAPPVGQPVPYPCRFIGWGQPTATTAINPIQQFVEANILNRNVCNELINHQGQVLDHMICAGLLTTGNGVCTGNLGGGLFCNANNAWQLTGVLSFGIGCGAANNPGVYTQVRFFEAWINQQFTRTDPTPAGTVVVE